MSFLQPSMHQERPAILRSSMAACLGCFTLAASSFAGDVALPAAGVAGVSPPYLADFEAAAFQLSSVDKQNGWVVEQGSAMVTDKAGRNGTRGLVLAAASPFSQARLTLVPGVVPSPVMFFEFYVLPVAASGGTVEEFMDVDGARVALLKSTTQPDLGVLHVFDGDGKGGGSWMATGITIPLGQSGVAVDWQRLTMRADFTRQTWDLWSGGQAAAADIGLQESGIGHPQNYITTPGMPSLPNTTPLNLR